MPEEKNRGKLGEGIVSSAIGFPFRHLNTLAEIGIAPILIVAALYFIRWQLLLPATGPLQPENLLQLQDTLFILDLLLWGATLLTGIIVAVGIHRFIVLGERPGWTIFRFRKWEAVYLLAIVVIALAYAGMLAFFGEGLVLFGAVPNSEGLARFIYREPFLYEFLQDPASYIVSTPVALLLTHPLQSLQNPIFASVIVIFGAFLLFLFLRLALIFPHAAISGRLSFATPWNATRGNFWSFVFIVLKFGLLLILIGLLFAIIWSILGISVFQHLNNESIRLIVSPMAAVISFAFDGLIFIMSVALISYVYQDLGPLSHGGIETQESLHAEPAP